MHSFGLAALMSPRAEPVSRSMDKSLPVGDETTQPIVSDHEDGTHVLASHQLGNVHHGRQRRHDDRIFRHDLANLLDHDLSFKLHTGRTVGLSQLVYP